MKKKDFFTEQFFKTFEEFAKEAKDNYSSGYSSKSASSGNSSTSASSGNSSKSASSGNYSSSSSSGYSSKSASSGNYSKSSCDGENSSATSNGFFSEVMGTTDGSVLCAIEFNKEYKPIGFAGGIVGKDLEANKWYIAHEGKLKEMIEVDGMKSILLHKKGKVMKVLLTNFTESYIVTDGTNYAHGSTVKEARESLIYKVSQRDKSEFEHF